MRLRFRFHTSIPHLPTVDTNTECEADSVTFKICCTLKCDCFSLAELQTICQMYWHRIYNLEGDKWELERALQIRKMEVNCILGLGMYILT